MDPISSFLSMSIDELEYGLENGSPDDGEAFANAYDAQGQGGADAAPEDGIDEVTTIKGTGTVVEAGGDKFGDKNAQQGGKALQGVAARVTAGGDIINAVQDPTAQNVAAAALSTAALKAGPAGDIAGIVKDPMSGWSWADAAIGFGAPALSTATTGTPIPGMVVAGGWDIARGTGVIGPDSAPEPDSLEQTLDKAARQEFDDLVEENYAANGKDHYKAVADAVLERPDLGRAVLGGAHDKAPEALPEEVREAMDEAAAQADEPQPNSPLNNWGYEDEFAGLGGLSDAPVEEAADSESDQSAGDTPQSSDAEAAGRNESSDEPSSNSPDNNSGYEGEFDGLGADGGASAAESSSSESEGTAGDSGPGGDASNDSEGADGSAAGDPDGGSSGDSEGAGGSSDSGGSDSGGSDSGGSDSGGSDSAGSDSGDGDSGSDGSDSGDSGSSDSGGSDSDSGSE